MKNLKYVTLGLLGIFVFSITSCGGEEKEVKWMDWETAERAAFGKRDKKFLVWIYDDECETCMRAEIKNFSNPAVNKFINDNFYVIKLDGHYKEPIVTKGNTYSYKPVSEVHELAIALTQSEDNISFPQIAFLNESMDLIVPVGGDMTLEDFRYLLAFVKQGAYERTNIDDFKKQYKPDF